MTGFLIWLAVGIALGLLHRWLPGGRPAWWAALVVGTLGAIAGGLAATILGFGGVAVFDARSTVTAILGAFVALNFQRIFFAQRSE